MNLNAFDEWPACITEDGGSRTGPARWRAVMKLFAHPGGRLRKKVGCASRLNWRTRCRSPGRIVMMGPSGQTAFWFLTLRVCRTIITARMNNNVLIVGPTFFARRKRRLAVRKTFSACAFISVAGLCTLPAFQSTTQAQHIPPYHGPGAEGQYSQGGNHESRHGDSGQNAGPHAMGQGQTFGPPGGRYIGGPTQYGPAAPSYWTYNRFSNNGFGGLNWYYGPLGGYTPYVNPYGSTMYGYPNYGPYYSYVPLAPVIRQTRPYWIGGDPFLNNANNNVGRQPNPADNPQLGAGPLAGQPAQEPVQPNVKIFGKAPTTDALRRSIRYQAQGDEWFGKQNYLQAYGHYKQAIAAAPARPEPRFRMALALAATTNYVSAVDEIKRAMRIDPTWPQTGPMLDELFGADNILSKNAVLHKVAAWVRADIRDPDRLFLMGVLLHFNDDPDKSHTFFEAASALAPVPVYAQAFLEAQDQHDARQHAAKPVEEPRPAPLDDAPLAEPPVPREGARREAAPQPGGPRFPAAAALDESERLLEQPTRTAQPQAPFGKGPQIAPGAGPKAIAPKIFRNPPGKAPEEPRPRPLARNAVDGAASLVSRMPPDDGLRMARLLVASRPDRPSGTVGPPENVPRDHERAAPPGHCDCPGSWA